MLKNLLFGGAGGGSWLADLGLLILRLYTGVVFAVMHGWDKFQDPSKFIGGTEKLGFPAPTLFGWMAIFAELAGGILLAMGLFTRPAAFLIAFTMTVAGFMAHAKDKFQVKELAFAYLAVALCLMLTGAGRYGMDTLARRRSGRKKIAVDRG